MPALTIQPYLQFAGRCEEAIEFYRTALGAEVLIKMLFDESPDPHPPGMVPDGWGKKIMHATLKIGEAIVMVSDGCGGELKFEGFTLSLALPDEASVKAAFDALVVGGKVQMPVMKTFWSPCFGMVEDKFGLGWMVTVPPEDFPS